MPSDHDFDPLSVADILELVQLVRGGVVENGPDILICSGHCLGSLGVTWKNRRGESGPVRSMMPDSPETLPETIEGCCEELELALEGDGAKAIGPFLESIVLRLLMLVFERLFRA
jgi:hypothetical protein